MSALTIFSPAKLNLFLAITGRRADGFHELVSAAVCLDWGDTLQAERAEEFSLACSDPAVPIDGANLVLKAAEAFRAATGWRGGARFVLEKRIPMGAGLGGGSSNAVAALRALNQLAGEPLTDAAMVEVAAGLGSDCALFLKRGPVVMRGRGERVESLPEDSAAGLSGRRFLMFKPGFSIATAWAYRRMVEAPESYLPQAEAEGRLAALSKAAATGARMELHWFNNMERVAFAKFVALPVLLDQLRERFGVIARMSGSGSACFALLPDEAPIVEIRQAIRTAWGESVFIIGARSL